MAKTRSTRSFDVEMFLNTVDGGRSVRNYRKNRKIFAQGEAADSVFYIQNGQVKLSVVSELGKEAVVALHGKGDFFGEGCLSGQVLRLATAAAITEGRPEPVIAKLSQETLAEMVGTTRSRVSFFMNKFRKLRPPRCWHACAVRSTRSASCS
jgi:signal-transduction protein with cAMP-binding, CBS, and nucleotidyltransferase domain